MTTDPHGRQEERDSMIANVEALGARLTSYEGVAPLDARVLDTMRKVPRHVFVPADWQGAAYLNRPLAIGHGQTISQPFIVALMTSLLRVEPGDKVLEAGTGSGYQGAVLSHLAAEVFSIEVVPELAAAARDLLQRLGDTNVSIRAGDAREGWPQEAPFDAIIVTAAAQAVPAALLEQLKPGGRMVIPVGNTSQDLQLIEKEANGATVTASIIPVRFVPLVGGD